MQVIYDEAGKIYLQGTGFPEPSGTLSYTNVTIPDGHFLKGIDTAKTPPEPIFEEYPKTEMQLMQERISELEQNQEALLAGAALLTGGTENEE